MSLLSSITLAFLLFYLQCDRTHSQYDHHVELKVFKVQQDGLQSCTNFCLNGANGEAVLKSKCIETFIGSTKYSCDYKRRANQAHIDALPQMTCHCQEPLQYELQFNETQQRLQQPPYDRILRLLSWNYQYVTLDFVDYKSELVQDGESSCQNRYLYLPDGWEVAPNDQITLSIIEQYSFSGAHYMILSDFNAYLTKLGRFEAFKRAKDNTLWQAIEGRIVEGNTITLSNNTDVSTLSQCKSLCVMDPLCRAIQYPHCILKTSTDTNQLDESFQFSTYVKLNMDTSIGVELKGNPDGLFVKYYSNQFGLKVPDAYCPGRILLRKIRTPLQCDMNGHWYELIDAQKANYKDAQAAAADSLYWRGAKGHLAVITSQEEQMECIKSLICAMSTDDAFNTAWIGGEKVGNEYKWTVNNTEESNTVFIDSTQNIKLGMYAPELNKWKAYNDMMQERTNVNSLYAITVCNDDEMNDWNIVNKKDKYYFVVEYELPMECEASDTVFEILGPPMEYYYAQEDASKQLWFGNNGYFGTIMDEEEDECIQQLGFCGVEKVWAAGSDNADNHRPHEWLWQSVYGPVQEMEKLFYVKGRPNDKRLGLYSNWNTQYQQPDNLLGEQHHLTICSTHHKTWFDESFHQRFRYLVEYKQMKPRNAPRILQLIGLDAGIKLSFSEPLHDGGSRIINCRVALHPIKINDPNSRYYPLNLVAYSLYRDVKPTARHFEAQHVYFNAINAIEYETELQCANKHGLSPPALAFKVTPIGPPEAPHKIWIVRSKEQSVVLGWKRPFSDGGTEIVKYHIRGIAIGRRGANCEAQCDQQFNEAKPPPNYTKLRSEHWDQYFAGALKKNESMQQDKAMSELQQFQSELADINKDEEEDIVNQNNDTIVDINATLAALTSNTNVHCLDIGFVRFIQPKDASFCAPFCWFIQQLECKYVVYRGSTQEILLTGYINDDAIIDPDSTNIGKYIAINTDNIERIEWTEMSEWVAQPKVHHMFSYGTSALDMLRIWGSWDNFTQGIPMHVTPENNGFVTWIGLHSGLFHYYFEGARQENGRPYFFTFIDDQQPFTAIWKETLKQFRDENVVRIQTREVIMQPYKVIDVNVVNAGNADAEYFEYEISGVTLFQEYKYEIWAESAVGEGPSIITNQSIHFTTPQIEKNAELLRHFFHATHGASWDRSWDMTDKYICGQYGVFCSDGLVERIHLIGNHLEGTLPFAIGDILTNLQILELSDNKLSSTIPKSLNELKQMHILRLANNKMEGSIPESIWSYPLLEFLDLGGNQFRGGIPDSIGQLTKLHSLRLHSNRFSGSLPVAMSQLKLLQHLVLFDNFLYGTIPAWLSVLERLRNLDLGNNDFTGSIPMHLTTLKDLQSLLLNDNALSGALESDLSLLTKLRYISVDNNQLEGSIPTSWGDRAKVMQDLRLLKVADNAWACPIPDYSKWAEITDYKNILSSSGGRCACLVSLWSEWSECHDSFGPGSVKVQTRDRRILVKAENGGPCYPLEEYRPCRVKPHSYFNGSIPNISVCISADSDNFGTDIDLTVFTTKIEIENIVITHQSGDLSCNRDHEWSFTHFGCRLCEPWQPLRFYTLMKNKCGSKHNIELYSVTSSNECAIKCHQTAQCLAFDVKHVNSADFECALKGNVQIQNRSNCNTYDFKTTAYYTLDTMKPNVRLFNENETDPFNGRVQVMYNHNASNSSTHLSTWGAVLSHGFDDNAGNVVCNSLGYNHMVKDIIRINSKNTEYTLNDTDEYVWIKQWQCTGHETSLWDCNNTLSTKLIKFDIEQHETVAVTCQPKVLHCDPFSVFITEENANQIQPKVIAPWFDPNDNGFEYIGCFEVGEAMHIQHWFALDDKMTPNLCYLQCVSHEQQMFYNVFVIKNGGYCGCGTEYGKYGLIDESKCNVQCLGDLDMMLCGGAGGYSAFEIEYYDKMLLQRDEGNDNRNIDQYEYYYSRFKTKRLSSNDEVLILPTQRGFVVDPSATYKIWYGENLRRINVENNIGESCVRLTIDVHDHPLSWLENEKEETIDDDVTEQLDYNQLFL
eukprot:44651_1